MGSKVARSGASRPLCSSRACRTRAVSSPASEGGGAGFEFRGHPDGVGRWGDVVACLRFLGLGCRAQALAPEMPGHAQIAPAAGRQLAQLGADGCLRIFLAVFGFGRLADTGVGTEEAYRLRGLGLGL